MTTEEKVATFDVSINNIYHEIKEIKDQLKEFRNISITNAQIVLQNDLIESRLKNVEDRLIAIEQEPASKFKRYKDLIITTILTALIGAIIGAIIALIIK